LLNPRRLLFAEPFYPSVTFGDSSPIIGEQSG